MKWFQINQLSRYYKTKGACHSFIHSFKFIQILYKIAFLCVINNKDMF